MIACCRGFAKLLRALAAAPGRRLLLPPPGASTSVDPQDGSQGAGPARQSARVLAALLRQVEHGGPMHAPREAVRDYVESACTVLRCPHGALFSTMRQNLYTPVCRILLDTHKQP